MVDGAREGAGGLSRVVLPFSLIYNTLHVRLLVIITVMLSAFSVHIIFILYTLRAGNRWTRRCTV